ncbi:MAG: pantoate kinase [Promethearchaeota archaeon]
MEFNIGDEIQVFVPHRISGLFQIVESGGGIPIEDISKVGSRGGGPSLTEYGITKIRIMDILDNDEVSKCEIIINGKDASQSAKTSYYVFSNLSSMFPKPLKIRIEHNFNLPIGCGYGASGCGAIGVSFGLNMLLKLGLTYNQAGKIAHTSEVLNKTGLGTVGGQLIGGLSITTRAGFPFEMDRIIVPPNVKIICTTFGPIPTDSIIGDPKHKKIIIDAGAWAMNELLEYPVFENFIAISRKFVEKTGLLEEEGMELTKELIERLNKLEGKIYGASMNQLGKSVYCFCDYSEEKKVLEVFETYKPQSKVIKSLEICHSGPFLK